MLAAELKTVCDWEGALHEGDTVAVVWRHAGSLYRGEAQVVRVNARSVRVRLTEEVTAVAGTYPAGREIVVPRVANIVRWGPYNRVEPVRGYRPVCLKALMLLEGETL